MSAKEIREMIRRAERRAKNVYVRPEGSAEPVLRIINAREHLDNTVEVLTIGGKWIGMAGKAAPYEQ